MPISKNSYALEADRFDLRKVVLKIVRSMRAAISDYLVNYGRDLRLDAWESVNVGSAPTDNHDEPDGNIEINAP